MKIVCPECRSAVEFAAVFEIVRGESRHTVGPTLIVGAGRTSRRPRRSQIQDLNRAR